ncbi:pyridoxamine 5'-phosphate oxidase-like FMN-binding protein [Stappia sp. 22II-S9-Z10]|nr:pyridoxamine 5'-phosphate oxidase-like FMN-binding protein [Stappia sp. 22II-S9-Z10]
MSGDAAGTATGAAGSRAAGSRAAGSPAAGSHAAGSPADARSLDAVEAAAWAMLEEGARSRHAAFHRMSLGSLGPGGFPEVRTVILRDADRAARAVRFNTDRRSPKVAAFKADPRCSLLLYDDEAKVQVRLKGRVQLHYGDPLAARLWSEMRAFSKSCYGQPVAPSAALGRPDGVGAEDTEESGAGAALSAPPLDDRQSFANFLPVTVHIASIDWLFLCAGGHRRALLCYGDSLSRTWLAP